MQLVSLLVFPEGTTGGVGGAGGVGITGVTGHSHVLFGIGTGTGMGTGHTHEELPEEPLPPLSEDPPPLSEDPPPLSDELLLHDLLPLPLPPEEPRVCVKKSPDTNQLGTASRSLA